MSIFHCCGYSEKSLEGTVTFCNMLVFYGEEMLAPHPILTLEDHPLLTVMKCLLKIFTADHDI
jgi:hypothetical protein